MAAHVSTNTAANTASGKVTGFAAGFLSSLDNGLGAGSGGMFASLLEATTTSGAVSVKLPAGTVSSQTSTSGTGSMGALEGDLKQIRSMLGKLQTWVENHLNKSHVPTSTQDGNNGSKSSKPTNGNAPPVVTPAVPSTPLPIASRMRPPVVSCPVANDPSSSVASTNASDDATDASSDDTATTLADILAELQQLAQMLHQYMQQIANGGQTPSLVEATTTTASISVGSDGSITLSATDTDLTNLSTIATPAAAAGTATDGTASTADDTSVLSQLDKIFPDLFRMLKDIENLTSQTSTTSVVTTSATPPADDATDTTAINTLIGNGHQHGGPVSLDDYPDIKPVDMTQIKSIVDRMSQFIKNGGPGTISLPIEHPLPGPFDPINGSTSRGAISVDDAAPAPTTDATTLTPATTATMPQSVATASSDMLTTSAKNTARTDRSEDAVPAFFAQMNNLPSSGGHSASDWDQDPEQAQGGNDEILTGQSSSTSQTTTADGTARTALGSEGVKSANPYTFASQLTATKASTAATSASVVDQVIMRLNKGAKVGQSEMTLQLSPADLGRIDIKLSFSGDGKVQGTVVASNQSTLDMLVKDVKGLERALQDAGLRADSGSLQFSLSQQQNNGSQTQQNYKTGTNVASNDVGGDVLAADTTIEETWVVTPGRVNMKV